jgi:AraC-like DNA-binding protein
MIRVETIKTYTWDAAEGLTYEQAMNFHEVLGRELGSKPPVGVLRSGLLVGVSLLVNTAMQTMYTNMRYKPTVAELSGRVTMMGYEMSDMALVQRLVSKIEAGASKDDVYAAAKLPVYKVDALFAGFFDNTYAVVSRDIRMTLSKVLVDSGKYDTLDEIASICGYAGSSFKAVYKAWHGEFPLLVNGQQHTLEGV